MHEKDLEKPKVDTVLEIDGSKGEGGGQVLRSCLSLSVITGRPFLIFNIRAKRPRPGLRAQHLASVRAAAKISGAEVKGAQIGSKRLVFLPGKVKPENYFFDIGTAGSVSLVFQTIFLPLALARAPSQVELRGGTHVPWSPCFHYIKEVFLPAVEAMGFRCKVVLDKWGFYPKGGGIVKAFWEPSSVLTPFSPGSASIPIIMGLSASSMLNEHVRKRQARSVRELLDKEGLDQHIQLCSADALCPGSIVFLWTKGGNMFAGFTSLGKRGKPSEEVGKEAAKKLLSFLESRSCCDRYLSDQLILPASIIGGKSSWTTDRITGHFATNAKVAEAFLGCNISYERVDPSCYLVQIDGKCT